MKDQPQIHWMVQVSFTHIALEGILLGDICRVEKATAQTPGLEHDFKSPHNEDLSFQFLDWFAQMSEVLCSPGSTSLLSARKEMTAVGFEPTPLRTGALSQRLTPLGQTVLRVMPF